MFINHLLLIVCFILNIILLNAFQNMIDEGERLNELENELEK